MLRLKPNTTDVDLQAMAKKLYIPLVFIGFRNELPKQPKPGAYIINLEASTEGMGSHWCGMYLAGTVFPSMAFYFDPFGAAAPEEAVQLMRRWTGKRGAQRHIYSNPYDIQNINGGFCGEYTIDFLHNIMHNPTKEGFIHFLNKYKHIIRIQKNTESNI